MPAVAKKVRRLMDHVVEEVPFYRDRTLVPGYHVGGKTGTAQIWDAKANEGRGAWKHNLFNYSFVGYIGREKDVPDLVVAVRIEEGTPTIARVGRLEMPVMSFELFRRIATDAITTPDLLTDRPVDDHARRRRPVSGALCDTADRDRRRPVDPGAARRGRARPHRRRPPPPDRRPAAGPLLPTDPRRAPWIRGWSPRASCSSRCPASGRTATPTCPRRSREARPRVLVTRPAARCRRRSGT